MQGFRDRCKEAARKLKRSTRKSVVAQRKPSVAASQSKAPSKNIPADEDCEPAEPEMPDEEPVKEDIALLWESDPQEAGTNEESVEYGRWSESRSNDTISN